MSDVKRYTAICEFIDEGYPVASMTAIPNGEFVTLADYDALAAERDALREELADSRMAATAEATRSDRLQADCARLREGVSKLSTDWRGIADGIKSAWNSPNGHGDSSRRVTYQHCADQLDAAIDQARQQGEKG